MSHMTPSLASIAFDCTDVAAIARFWAALLDRVMPEDVDGDFVQLAGEPTLSFVTVPEHKTVKNRVHLDLEVADIAAAVDRAVALGAIRLRDFDENGYRWTTLADPGGNEFDLVAAG